MSTIIKNLKRDNASLLNEIKITKRNLEKRTETCSRLLIQRNIGKYLIKTTSLKLSSFLNRNGITFKKPMSFQELFNIMIEYVGILKRKNTSLENENEMLRNALKEGGSKDEKVNMILVRGKKNQDHFEVKFDKLFEKNFKTIKIPEEFADNAYDF